MSLLERKITLADKKRIIKKVKRLGKMPLLYKIYATADKTMTEGMRRYYQKIDRTLYEDILYHVETNRRYLEIWENLFRAQERKRQELLKRRKFKRRNK